MDEIKNGDKVYASNLSEKRALKDRTVYTFIGMKDSKFVCEHSSGFFEALIYAVKVPEKVPVPFSTEELILLWQDINPVFRKIGTETLFRIIKIDEEPGLEHFITNHEFSFKGTWRPLSKRRP